MYSNPFIDNNDEYKRDFNIVKKYVKDSSFFLHKMKDLPLETCEQLVKKTISKEGDKPLSDPKILILEREENGDKIQKESTFLSFLKDTQEKKDLTSPTLTTYLHPSKKESMIARFLGKNMARRKEVKKRGHLAEMEKDFVLTSYCYNLQTAIKIINNSVSGAHGSAGTPLYNHSSHPALTSTCRCATSYANANNERFLEGMRHYWCYEVTQSDIISIVANSDYEKISKTMEEYAIKHPEVEDVINIIKKSTDHYWSDEVSFNKLIKLIEKLTPIERSAYLYTQDCYSLFKLNPTFVKQMINDMATRADEMVEDPDYWVSLLDGDMLMTVSIIASDYLNGRTLNKVKETDTNNYKKIGATIKNFILSREKYRSLINTFWKTNHLPPSIGYYPSAIRKAVIVSDTDSTIFSVANWVERVEGKLTFDAKGKSVATVMVYLASQTLKHILATYSAYMGVIPERIFQLTMKNEFMMESLMLTTKGKHYAYRIIAKEGNVYSNPSLDIKGVTLRNSKVPEAIRKELRQTIEDILENIKSGSGINILDYLKRVGNLEHEILEKIRKGSSEYLTRQKIRSKESYRTPMTSGYYYYELWQRVFADKYGQISELPVATAKVSLDFDNKTKFDMWLESLEDKVIARRLKEFLIETNRKFLKCIYVPIEIATNDGIPKEILSAADVRKVIYTSTEGFYLVMESLGFYCQNDQNSRLIMDTYGEHLEKRLEAH